MDHELTYKDMGAPFSLSDIESMLKGEQLEQVRIGILEEPQQRGYRFRYECEGPSHGGLQGVDSEKNSKTYPTIMITGLDSPRAQVTVSLWTADEPPRPHVHDLIGKSCDDGKFVMEVKRESYGKVVFNNLSIRNTKKTDVVRILKERKMRENQMHFLPVVSDEQLMQAAEAEAKEMQLNVVRLKFEVTPLGDLCAGVLAAAMSQPVYDSKCPAASLLKICRISCTTGTCRGGTEVFMLCEKVQKDIKIRFREREKGSFKVKWEDYATFSPMDIHRQYAIVFRTPAYCNQQLTDDVEVELQLVRHSDGQESPSLPFKYCADRSEQDQIVRKRKRVVFDPPTSSSSSYVFDPFAGIAPVSDSGGGGGPTGNIAYGVAPLPNISTLDTPYPPFSAVLQQDPMAGFASYHGMSFNQAPVAELMQPGEYQPTVGAAADLLMPTLDMGASDFNLSQDLSDDLVEMDSAPDCEVAQPPAPWTVPGWKDPSFVKGRPLSPTSAAHIDIYEVGATSAASSAKRTHSHRVEEPKKSMWMPPLPSEAKPSDVPVPSVKMQSAAGNATVAAANAEFCTALVHKVGSELTRSVHDYAASGDVRFMLAVMRGLLCEPDYNGDNPFHVAVINERLDALRSLLSAGGEVTATALGQTNLDGQTPLHLAAVLQQARVVELLLTYGADASAQDANGNSVWHLAARNADLATLRVLRSRVPSDVTRRCINVLNYDGLSALHVAVRARAADCVKELVACGADANVADGKSGRTALHLAVECDDINLTSYLIFTAGANVDQPSYDGNTPLHVASATGSIGIVATLIAFGADTMLENGDPKVCECENEACQLSEEGVHGHTARDVACNRQIADLLDGKHSSTRDDPLARSVACHAGSPNAAAHRVEGDMARLDDRSRRELAAMLDRSPELWSRLAALVGLNALVPALKEATSPTQALLTDYEAMDGTTADLCRCLVQMNLHEAAQLVERQCPAGKNVDGSSGHSCDSGVGTSFANHDSLRSLDSC